MEQQIIKVGNEFTISKTDNRFVEVVFEYPKSDKWEGCFPVYYPNMSIEFSSDEVKEQIPNVYEAMRPSNRINLIEAARNRWPKGRETETYKVFEALLTGGWKCRGCGAGKINDQPAARIRDIKKFGYVVATQTRWCPDCLKSTYHDILLLFEVSAQMKPEFRLPISDATKARVIKVLDRRDVFANVKRSPIEFVIDHKFPSQRWTEVESDNESLSNEDIKQKFQLLTNQSNMLKSRMCDRCCSTGERQGFLGIDWFYAGSKAWIPNDDVYGSGCDGCAWFDLDEWRNRLNESLD